LCATQDYTNVVEALSKESAVGREEQPNGHGPSDEDNEGEEAQPTTVLVNLVADLFALSSPLLRKAGEEAFKAYSEQIGEQAVRLLLEVRAICIFVYFSRVGIDE
jgi:hypothetical protein